MSYHLSVMVTEKCSLGTTEVTGFDSRLGQDFFSGLTPEWKLGHLAFKGSVIRTSQECGLASMIFSYFNILNTL